MATLISPFKKLIFLISFVILLTGIFFGFVSIQNCVLNYNPPKTKSQIEQLVKKVLTVLKRGLSVMISTISVIYLFLTFMDAYLA
ncbi:hypothetical protein [Lactococcus lactis]|uniref:hypothetical protein n=1 Tax=Lactococcus lactis TaxID=1358 RepID=UPI00223B57CA|nr:hypothetical protein [Lactococcus lactis]